MSGSIRCSIEPETSSRRSHGWAVGAGLRTGAARAGTAHRGHEFTQPARPRGHALQPHGEQQQPTPDPVDHTEPLSSRTPDLALEKERPGHRPKIVGGKTEEQARTEAEVGQASSSGSRVRRSASSGPRGRQPAGGGLARSAALARLTRSYRLLQGRNDRDAPLLPRAGQGERPSAPMPVLAALGPHANRFGATSSTQGAQPWTSSTC